MLLNLWIIFVTSRMDLSAIELQLLMFKDSAEATCVVEQMQTLVSFIMLQQVGVVGGWITRCFYRVYV